YAGGGKVVVTADYYGEVSFWDASTGLLLRRLPGRPGNVLAVAPGGSLLATGGMGPAVQIWDIATGHAVRALEATPGQGQSGLQGSQLAVAPAGKTLAGAMGEAAYLWDVETGKQTAALAGHKHGVCAVAFAPDGKTIATGEAVGYAPRDFTATPDCSVTLWDA